MSLYKVNVGDAPLASDVNQYTDALTGVNDIGQITLAAQVAAPSSAPSGTAVAGTGLGVGTYKYVVTYLTGYRKSNGTIVTGGETPASPQLTVTTTSGNQRVNLSNIPISSSPTVIGRRIYRTTVNGSTFYKLADIWDNGTTTYTDTTADGSLVTSVTPPTTNTTGTYFNTVYVGPNQRGQFFADGNTMVHLRNQTGLTFLESKLNLYLMSNAYYDGVNFNRLDTSQPASAIVIQYNGEPQFRSVGAGANPITWNSYNIFHEGNFTTRTHVEAYLSTNQSLTNNSWNRIKFDTILYDYQNEFNTANGNWYFQAANDGVYMISVGVRIQGLNQNSSYVVLSPHLLNGSGNYWILGGNLPSANATTMTMNGTLVLFLGAGTQVEFRVYYQDTSQTATLVSGNNYTWLNISRVA